MQVRISDWRPHFRRKFTATQAATTPVRFVGVGVRNDGTYTDWDTNLDDKGEVPGSDNLVLQGLGFYFDLTSTPADARDALVKVINGLLFRVVVNDYAELDWTPVALFPAGVGFSIDSQDTVTAGKDLWAAMGIGDPRTLQAVNQMAEHRLPLSGLQVKGGISLPANTRWYVEAKLEAAMALTTGNTLGVHFVGRGVKETARVN
jgi:hypothetical protein